MLQNVNVLKVNMIMDIYAVTVTINVLLVMMELLVRLVMDSEKMHQTVIAPVVIMMLVLPLVKNVNLDVKLVMVTTNVLNVITKLKEVELLVNVQKDMLMLTMVLLVMKHPLKLKKISSQPVLMILVPLLQLKLTHNLLFQVTKLLLDSITNSNSETLKELNYL